jgi:hypothetical protein
MTRSTKSTETTKPEKRIVTDTLTFGDAPVAYILHSDHHEAICPWCAQSLGDIVMPPSSTVMQLYLKLFNETSSHMDTCLNREATEMAVKVNKPFDPNKLN